MKSERWRETKRLGENAKGISRKRRKVMERYSG